MVKVHRERILEVAADYSDALMHKYVAEEPVTPQEIRAALREGGAEGLDPNPLFDTDWYRARNPEVDASGVNPLLHYVRSGAPRISSRISPVSWPGGAVCSPALGCAAPSTWCGRGCS